MEIQWNSAILRGVVQGEGFRENAAKNLPMNLQGIQAGLGKFTLRCYRTGASISATDKNMPMLDY